MAKEFNSLDIFFVNRSEYRAKAIRLFVSLMLGAILLALLIGAISVIHQLLTNGEYGYFDLFFEHLYAFVTGNHNTSTGSEIISFPIVVIEAMVGLLISFVVAGVIAILVSRSVNPIEICSLSTIHTDGSDIYGQEIGDAGPCFEFRYFVKYPDEIYLSNAFVSISIMEAADRVVGRGKTRTLFKYEEHYGQIRGVRYLSIPLSTKDENDITLLEALSKYMNEYEEKEVDGKRVIEYKYIAVARVGGVAPNGEQVSCVRILKQDELGDGCKFVSIRHTECTGDKEAHKGVDYIYFEHFDKLYKCSNGPAVGFPWKDEIKGSLLDEKEIKPSLYDKIRNITRRIANRKPSKNS